VKFPSMLIYNLLICVYVVQNFVGIALTEKETRDGAVSMCGSSSPIDVYTYIHCKW